MAITDKFANIANLEITESGANTLTFQELKTGAGIFEKMAMVIHRIEYMTTGVVWNLPTDGADALNCALVTSNQITTLAKDKAQVIDLLKVVAMTAGTPANKIILALPIVPDLASLPGGGLIVPATNLYGAALGVSVASASYWRMTLYFTYKELKGEEFWELVEATRALS